MAANEQPQLYYDISAIKQIPILDVADRLGIPVQKKGSNFWCKVRNEKIPSVILHPDRNTFYDFGNQTHGDVIRLVQYVNNVSCGKAIRYLANSFGLEPSMTKQQLLNRPLTNWEYSQIGLHGDLATKNLVFPIETATLEELADLSWYYRMPMNTLQKKHPELYRELIEQKAVPHVESMRNRYYLDVWNYFHLAYALADNSINLFRSKKARERFSKDTTALNQAERILYRACKNAGLEAPEPLQHDPVEVIRKLLHGEITIDLGNRSEKALSQTAKELGCSVKESHVNFYSYFNDKLLQYEHAAQYQGGKVTLQYLSKDESNIRPILEQMQKEPNRPLEERIAQVSEKRSSLVPERPQKPQETYR